MTSRADIASRLPAVLGLKQTEAAAAIGVSVTHFVKMQQQGLMPRPRMALGVPVYDIEELRQAFSMLPYEDVGSGTFSSITEPKVLL